MSKPEISHYFNGSQVVRVVHIKDDYYSFSNAVFKIDDVHNIFLDKNDAMYQQLLHKLNNGTALNNYKGSKYYGYYIERLKNDNPEYLI